MAIDLYSGVPGSGKSLIVTYRAIDSLLSHKNVISNFPMDMSYFKRRRHGKFFYIPTEKITVKFLVAFAKANHDRSGHQAKKAQTIVLIDEAEIKFNSRLFASPDRMEWIFFFANHRHFNYDFWLAAQSDRMLDRQIRDLIQTEYKCRAIKGFGVEGKIISLLFGGLFCSVPYDHATHTKFLVPQFYRFHKRKANVYDTMYMFDGMGNVGKLSSGGKKYALDIKKEVSTG
ncbi:Zot domain-containing protein [Ruminococcaceae bacterium BL-6]|nr:Zot domain-containing protein [Ruminococcaceae bacterium BL-6]CAB1247997.1 Zot domain-containing protein [Ruminococcaceae bacterium BL-6]